MKNHWRRFSFVSKFKKLTFARLFSLNLSKFESYNLQHCNKNCRKLVFCVFPEQLLPFIFLGGYIALAKKSFINDYHKKVKQRFSNKKDLKKNLLKFNEKKTRAFWD